MEIDPAFSQRLAELGLQSRIAWAAATVLLVLLVLFAARGGRRLHATTREPSLIRCDSATASIEFLLVLFPFMFIVLTVWQLAFMFNARLHVGYAAYAAARAAAVQIPAELPGEKEGELKKYGEANAKKWEKIARAAIPGTFAISPGSFTDAGGTIAFAGGGSRPMRLDTAAIVPRMTLMTAHYFDLGVLGGTRLTRGLVKNWYSSQMTQVLVNGKDDRAAQDLKKVDTVTVTVNYVFWLQVPYVGRMLEALFKGRVIPGTSTPIFTTPFPSMTMSETITMTSWLRKRAIEPGGG
jgi:hypothetical protein